MLGPTDKSQVVGTCVDELVGGGTDTKILAVTYEDARTAYDRLAETIGEPVDLTLVAVHRGHAAPDSDLSWAFDDGIEVVETSNDLTSIALTVSDVLDEWESDDEVSISFCFDSLTHTLVDNDLERVFRFCHAMDRYVSSTGSGHFHLTRDVHDTQTVQTLSTVFGETIEL